MDASRYALQQAAALDGNPKICQAALRLSRTLSGEALRRFSDALERHRGVHAITIDFYRLVDEEANDGEEEEDAFLEREAERIVAAERRGEGRYTAGNDGEGGSQIEAAWQGVRDVALRDAREVLRRHHRVLERDREERDRELRRVFEDIFLNHPSIDRHEVSATRGSTWLEQYVGSLVGKNRMVPNLAVCETKDPACLRAVARMLCRNALVKELTIMGCGSDVELYKLICDAVPRNEHLRYFWVEDDDLEPRADTLAGPLGAESRLTNLRVGARWTMRGFAGLVDLLRTNVTLSNLFLSFSPGASEVEAMLQMLEEMLRSGHNRTLQNFKLDADSYAEREPFLPYQERIQLLLRPNRAARAAHELLRARDYRVEPLSVLPVAMERVRFLPGAIYSLVRRGNAGSLADRLQREESPGETGEGGPVSAAAVLRLLLNTVQDNFSLLESSFPDHRSVFEAIVADVQAIASEAAVAGPAFPGGAVEGAAGGDGEADRGRGAKRARHE